MGIKIKRVYEKPGKHDGRRALVDRVWPRGLKKEQAKVDFWLKDIAPSTELRKWFGPAVRRLKQELDKGPVTLLYAAKDEEHNQAVVLRESKNLFH